MPSSQRGASAGNRTVRLVTLGCARNEVDSEELAARLEASGWTLIGAGGSDDDGGPGDSATADADGDYREAAVVLVNTCGFIEAAKQDSIGELLSAADSGSPVVAAGCLAERYGADLAEALPEAEVISFDDYPDIGAVLDRVVAGERRRPTHRATGAGCCRSRPPSVRAPRRRPAARTCRGTAHHCPNRGRSQIQDQDHKQDP